MLQSISKNYNEEENDNLKINFKEITCRLFSIRNIVIYIISFMISMVSFVPGTSIAIAPFGLALVAAAISTEVPIAIVYLSSLIGTFIKFGGDTGLIYLLTSILFLVTLLIKRPNKNEYAAEKNKIGGHLFLSVLAVSLIKMAFNGFLVYDLLVAIVLSVSTYIFYKIFSNSINVISEYGIKKAFSIEEVIGASLLITIAVSALGNFSIFSFSIRNIICIFLILALGFKNGVLVGGVSGITVGIVLGIIGDGNPMLIATYAISGMLAGLLNRFGKIGVIVGFILGNIIITYSANGGLSNIIMFQEILIASIGLLALPKSIKIDIEEILPKTKLLPEATGRIEESADTILKLNSISQTIEDLSKSYEKNTAYEKNVAVFEEEVIKALEGLENNILYEYFIENENDLLQDVFNNIIENNILTENGIITVLAKHNIYLMNSDNNEAKILEKEQIDAIIKAINSAYRVCKNDAIWQKKIDENNKNMFSQLNHVKAAIDDITEKIEEDKTEADKFNEEEKQIKEMLLKEDVLINNISLKQENTGRFVINAYTNICKEDDINKCPIKQIQKACSKILNKELTIQNQKCGIRLNSDICEYSYISADKYILQTGIARAKKDGSIVSGDMISQIRLGDGKYLLAISDGMGSGPDARKNSKIAISMLERLLSSGFDKDTSINLINSAILTANKEEMYATLDIEIFDLYAGKIQFLKNGACPTYIKKNRNVTILESNSLPAGIMEELKIDTYDKDLEDGNIMVICSDGIIESNKEYANRELWVKYLLEDMQTDSPERIADIILKEAIDNDFGIPKDDMSVIVAKVIKK